MKNRINIFQIYQSQIFIDNIDVYSRYEFHHSICGPHGVLPDVPLALALEDDEHSLSSHCGISMGHILVDTHCLLALHQEMFYRRLT